MDSRDSATETINMNLEIRVFKKTMGKYFIITEKITHLGFQKRQAKEFISYIIQSSPS